MGSTSRAQSWTRSLLGVPTEALSAQLETRIWGSGSRVQVGDANMGVIRGDGGRRRKGHSRSISSPGEIGRTQTLPVLSNVGQEQETGKDNECQWSSNSSSRKWAQKVGSSEGRAWKNEDEEMRQVCSGQTTGKAEPELNDRLLATSQPSAVL